MNNRFVLIAVAACGLALGVAADRAVASQQPAPSIKRTVLLRTDAPDNPKYELVMAEAEIPAGGTSGKHFHHGVEVAYVLSGSVTIEVAGKAAVTYKAGQAMKNDSGGVHNAINTSKKPVKILAVYLVEKGKPVAESVP